MDPEKKMTALMPLNLRRGRKVARVFAAAGRRARLLDEHDGQGDAQRRAHGAVDGPADAAGREHAQDLAEADGRVGLGRVLVALGDELAELERRARLVAAAERPQRPLRRVEAPAPREPGRRLREQEAHGHEEAAAAAADPREDAPPPAAHGPHVAAAVEADGLVGEEEPDEVDAEDAQRHRELVRRAERAAERRRGRLSDVDGHRDGRDADGDAERDARADERARRRRRRRERPRRRVDGARDGRERAAAADGVEEPRAADGADHAADVHDGAPEARERRRHRVVLAALDVREDVVLHARQRRAREAEAVAEDDGAHGGAEGAQDRHEAPLRAQRRRVDRRAADERVLELRHRLVAEGGQSEPTGASRALLTSLCGDFVAA